MILLFIADGRSIHTQRWAEYFAQKGHEVHIITYDPMGRTIPGVTEYVLTSRHLAIKKIVQKVRPDLIHAHFIAKYGFHLPGLCPCPTIVSAWGDDVLILPKKSRLIHYYTKKVLDGVDLIYAVSKNIGSHIVDDFCIPQEKVRYLPFGIDMDLFAQKSATGRENPETIEVFSNRGFFSVYDNETLVRGFARAYEKDHSLRLTLKGDGPMEEQIRNLVNELGFSEVISFRKKTEYAQVPGDYQRADIFLTTSTSDGTPVSILEAMASGLPCIATTVGGIPEWIEDKKTGILIPPCSPEAVADAIALLAHDPALRSRMGTAAREVVVRNGQWNTLMVQAEKDYQALIKTYKQDRP
jgi:glycosyltransferase involved in cell wall biosynthesis